MIARLPICFLLLTYLVNLSCLGQSTTSADSISQINPLREAFITDSLPDINTRFGRYYIKRRKLPTREVLDRLSCTDSLAFNSFRKGKQAQKIGGITAVVGAGVFVIGEVVYITSAINDFLDIGPEKSSYPGTGMLVTGGGLVVSGLAVAILGKIKKNNAIKLYNKTVHSGKRNFTWYVKPSIHKISIGLKF